MIWAGYGIDNPFTSLLNISPTPVNTSTGSRTTAPVSSLLALNAQQPKLTSLLNLTQPVSTRRAPPSTPQTSLVQSMVALNQATQVPKLSSLIPAFQANQANQAAASFLNKLASGGSQSGGAASILPFLPGGGSAQPGIAPVDQQRASGACGDVAGACSSAGGSWDGEGCALPDGSRIGVDSNCQPKCLNSVGACTGAQPASKGGGAMMIGAAALAALLFLR